MDILNNSLTSKDEELKKKINEIDYHEIFRYFFGGGNYGRKEIVNNKIRKAKKENYRTEHVLGDNVVKLKLFFNNKDKNENIKTLFNYSYHAKMNGYGKSGIGSFFLDGDGYIWRFSLVKHNYNNVNGIDITEKELLERYKINGIIVHTRNINDISAGAIGGRVYIGKSNSGNYYLENEDEINNSDDLKNKKDLLKQCFDMFLENHKLKIFFLLNS